MLKLNSHVQEVGEGGNHESRGLCNLQGWTERWASEAILGERTGLREALRFGSPD